MVVISDHNKRKAKKGQSWIGRKRRPRDVHLGGLTDFGRLDLMLLMIIMDCYLSCDGWR